MARCPNCPTTHPRPGDGRSFRFTRQPSVLGDVLAGRRCVDVRLSGLSSPDVGAAVADDRRLLAVPDQYRIDGRAGAGSTTVAQTAGSGSAGSSTRPGRQLAAGPAASGRQLRALRTELRRRSARVSPRRNDRPQVSRESGDLRSARWLGRRPATAALPLTAAAKRLEATYNEPRRRLARHLTPGAWLLRLLKTAPRG